MSKRCKFTAEEKHNILMAYEKGATLREMVSVYSIADTTIQEWRYRYQTLGFDGLNETTTWKTYSKELKEQAVSDYLSGNYSLRQIARHYGVSSDSVLRRWIKRHTDHRELKATGKGTGLTMIKARAVSWKERIEIVQHCMVHNKDYQTIAEAYGVSYQQLYHWVNKYELNGEEGLKDRRGRKKADEELSNEDRIRLSIKRLEVENERLKAENAFLKKLKELERGLR